MVDYILRSSLHLTLHFTEALPRPQVPSKNKKGARGVNGKEAKRGCLGDLAFKMEDDNRHNICRSQNAFIFQDRPVYVAFLEQKLPCPHVFCTGKGSFLKIDGVDRYYHTIHRKAVTDKELNKEARKAMKILYGKETSGCLRKFTNIRSQQVIIL